MLRTQASDEEVNDVSSRRPLYCGRAGSDVTLVDGQQVVFLYCMLQARVTLTQCLVLYSGNHGYICNLRLSTCLEQYQSESIMT